MSDHQPSGVVRRRSVELFHHMRDDIWPTKLMTFGPSLLQASTAFYTTSTHWLRPIMAEAFSFAWTEARRIHSV